MSYQVLARKWRPKNFAEMVGQEHILRALVHALDQQRLHQAYLFTGTRGVGKTSIARILAKALNCEQGVSSKPCGKCSVCTEIDQGRFLDLIEVDAASRTKVEDTRELLDNVQYSPTRGRFKIYLIDEVHMLSTHSFNALLKTLEEPPANVKLVLATTDPQKLPATILSRCLQFNLKRMPPDLIEKQLQRILAEEGVTHDAASLKYLAQAADGSMRDALSLLDQAIAYGQGQLRGDEIARMLGNIARNPVYDVLRALISRDAARLLESVRQLDEHAPDYTTVLDDLITILQQVALAQWDKSAIDADLEDGSVILEFARELSAEDIQLFYQIALLGKRDLALSPSVRRGFEMTLLRMLAFSPADEKTKIPANAARSTPAAPITKPEQAGGKLAVPPVSSVQPERTGNKPIVPPVGSLQADNVGTPVPWRELIARLNLKGMVAELAANCSVKSWQGDSVLLILSEDCPQLAAFEGRLAEALTKYAGKSITLKIEIGKPSAETPAQTVVRQTEETQQAAVQSIQQDGLVRALQEKFDAEVIVDSVRPN
jgi:DNA polymerase-3 subunit gamma/tau